MSFRPRDFSRQEPYDPTFYEPLAAAEERHFWFRVRNRIIETLARQVTADFKPGFRALEVGCGTGNVLRVLVAACPQGTVIGMDFFGEALSWARRRVSGPLLQADVRTPPFRVQFELIGLFDVLEHLADDGQALRDLHALLGEGGVLLLTVPAHASLWSYWDEACQHYRRYASHELQDKLTATGYRVEYLTPFMAPLLPLMWLKRRLAPAVHRGTVGGTQRGRELAARELRIIPGVNTLLEWILVPEVALIARRCRLPIGTSLLAVARKIT